MSHKKGIDFLLEVNAENARSFMAQQERRRLYRKRHGSEILVFKCMDGRLNLSVMTKIPLGILQPFRNLGGVFEIGSPFFQQAVHGCKRYADSKGRDSLAIVTYHFSRSDKRKGCAGHRYETEGAMHSSLKLKKGFDDYGTAEVASGRNETRMFSIQVGIETDLDALILHGESGKRVDLAERDDLSVEEDILKFLIGLYPLIFEKAPNVIDDLVPLVRGNIQHIAGVRSLHRPPQDADHKESVLAVGRGFDWLHLPNKALIVGPWQNNLADPIRTAMELIKKNKEVGVLDDPNIVLLTSGVYREEGGEKFLAQEKSLYLKTIAMGVINAHFKDILPSLQVLATTVNLNTRLLDVIERSH